MCVCVCMCIIYNVEFLKTICGHVPLWKSWCTPKSTQVYLCSSSSYFREWSVYSRGEGPGCQLHTHPLRLLPKHWAAGNAIYNLPLHTCIHSPGRGVSSSHWLHTWSVWLKGVKHWLADWPPFTVLLLGNCRWTVGLGCMLYITFLPRFHSTGQMVCFC